MSSRVAAWLQAVPEEELHVSVLTLGEIRKGTELLPSGKRRDQFERWLETVLQSWFSGLILPVDHPMAERWGIRGTPIAVIDGLLAATAAQHRLTVVTRDTKHFDGAGPSLQPLGWGELWVGDSGLGFGDLGVDFPGFVGIACVAVFYAVV